MGHVPSCCLVMACCGPRSRLTPTPMENQYINRLIVFAMQFESTIYVRVYSNSQFQITNGSRPLTMLTPDPNARFTQAHCIHNVHILNEIRSFKMQSSFAFRAGEVTSLRVVNDNVSVVIADSEGSSAGVMVRQNKWFLNAVVVFCKKDGTDYAIGIRSPDAPHIFHLNGKVLPLASCGDDHLFTDEDCIYNNEALAAGQDGQGLLVYSVPLDSADSLVLEVDWLALVIKSCISDQIAGDAQTISPNLKAWSNIIPGDPPKDMFHTFPCFSNEEVLEMDAKCRSLAHLRRHRNFVLGHVGYKGDYTNNSLGNPMSVVKKNRMLQEHFQPYIDTMMERLSSELGEPVFTLPYVFLPGLHYQDGNSPNFQHGRDIFFGEFHCDGQHTRLQQQLGDIERLYGIKHNIDYERRYTATCCITEGGMYMYPTQELSTCCRDDPHYSVTYSRGWINLHSGRWVHQISTHQSLLDRICWQAHLVWCDDAERRGWLIYW